MSYFEYMYEYTRNIFSLVYDGTKLHCSAALCFSCSNIFFTDSLTLGMYACTHAYECFGYEFFIFCKNCNLKLKTTTMTYALFFFLYEIVNKNKKA